MHQQQAIREEYTQKANIEFHGNFIITPTWYMLVLTNLASMCTHAICSNSICCFLLQRVCGPVGPQSAFAPPSHPAMGAVGHPSCHLPLQGGAVFLLPFILPLQLEVSLRFWRQQFGVPAETAYPPPQNPPARSPGVFAHVQQWA